MMTNRQKAVAIAKADWQNLHYTGVNKKHNLAPVAEGWIWRGVIAGKIWKVTLADNGTYRKAIIED